MSVTRKCDGFTRAREAMTFGVYPFYPVVQGQDDGTVRVGDIEYVMIGSNNYLGLTVDPRVLRAASDAVRRYGSSATGSRLLNGNLDLHEELEHELRDFFGTGDALVFPTGYQANLGAICGLAGPGDLILVDRDAHASLIDGARMSRARMVYFAHNDPADLEDKLLRHAPDARGGVLVVVDGVYSMGGDIAPVAEIAAVTGRFGATLLVDDAHGAGVLGGGRGTCAHLGVEPTDDVIITITFSKAFASIGGAVLAGESVVHYLRHNARSVMFSASATPSSTAAALAAVRIAREEPERCARVVGIADRVRAELTALGYDTGPSRTPIVPVATGGDDIVTMRAQRLLMERGVYANAVVPPAATACLRTSYIATHTDEQIDRVVEAFTDLRESLPGGSGQTLSLAG
jgi:8-amino-7-oxononanoate synthase